MCSPQVLQYASVGGNVSPVMPDDLHIVEYNEVQHQVQQEESETKGNGGVYITTCTMPHSK